MWNLDSIHKVLVVALPGAGKSTQGRMLATEVAHCAHISFGDHLRTHFGHLKHQITDHSAPLMQSRTLPTEQAREVFEHALSSALADGKSLLLVDGIPKGGTQAKALKPHLQFDMIIRIGGISDEDLLARIAGRSTTEARGDDKDRDVSYTRIIHAKKDIADVLDCYGDTKLVEIDGNGSKDDVNKLIVKALEQFNLLSVAEPHLPLAGVNRTAYLKPTRT